MASSPRVGTSSVAVLFVMALIFGLAAWLAPDWIEMAGLDVWELPALRNHMEDLNRKELVINAEFEDLRERMAVKEELIDSLLAGRVTLQLATSEFIALDQAHPRSLCSILAAYNGATREEKVARNVIEFAMAHVADMANQKAVIRRRLESELQKLISGKATDKR